ncbi:hypothetical protein COU60_00080 [Candidatus Pacearchaeota archaeon CG10_big_fil_rev_8_21_14_0_10_34_76]|nr:MAG: hypothetical protein COU60_00080 [Candidatus Pacearchaeota archaeon CG10_big_fil_rev_8_21_14_0_10_34_76]
MEEILKIGVSPPTYQFGRYEISLDCVGRIDDSRDYEEYAAHPGGKRIFSHIYSASRGDHYFRFSSIVTRICEGFVYLPKKERDIEVSAVRKIVELLDRNSSGLEADLVEGKED